MRPFQPYAATNLVAGTTGADRVQLPGTFQPQQPRTVRIYNAGSVAVALAFGDSAVTAAATDLTMPPGAVEVFSVQQGLTHVAARAASGSCTLNITAGEGI